MRTRQRAAICSTFDDRWVVAAQQPQSRGVVSTFEPRARALTVRMFGAITAVLSGRCESVAVCLSPAVTLLQLLSATCSTSMVVLWSATTARTALAARRSKPESGREQNTGDGCAIARDGGGEGLHALELSLRRLQRAGPQLRRPWVHQCSEDAGGQQRPPRLRVPRLQNRESLLESSANCRAFGRFQRSSQSPPGQSLHVRRQRGRRVERKGWLVGARSARSASTGTTATGTTATGTAFCSRCASSLSSLSSLSWQRHHRRYRRWRRRARRRRGRTGRPAAQQTTALALHKGAGEGLRPARALARAVPDAPSFAVSFCASLLYLGAPTCAPRQCLQRWKSFLQFCKRGASRWYGPCRTSLARLLPPGVQRACAFAQDCVALSSLSDSRSPLCPFRLSSSSVPPSVLDSLLDPSTQCTHGRSCSSRGPAPHSDDSKRPGRTFRLQQANDHRHSR